MESKFKRGDIVFCKPGFLNGEDNYKDSPKYGGCGYKEFKIFKIGDITELRDGKIIYWPDDGGSGIFEGVVDHINNMGDKVKWYGNKLKFNFYIDTLE